MGVLLIVLALVSATLVALVALTVDGLSKNIGFSAIQVTEKGGLPVFSASATIHNPGPLPLERLSVGIVLYAEPDLVLRGYSATSSVAVGQNISVPVSLSLEAAGGVAACRLLFYGDQVRLGAVLNTSVGGFLPIHAESYNNLSMGALLGDLSVTIVVQQASGSETTYLLKYSFVDQNSYLPVNGTLAVLFGQTVVATVPLQAYPGQPVSESEDFTTNVAPQQVSVVVYSGLGAYRLAQLSQNTYGGGVCG